jgi:hypothetical protein
MNSAAHHGDFRLCAASAAQPKQDAGAKKPDVLRRLLAAIPAFGQRQLDREIASVLALSGGRFTDAIEREIDQRILGSTWGGFESH